MASLHKIYNQARARSKGGYGEEQQQWLLSSFCRGGCSEESGKTVVVAPREMGVDKRKRKDGGGSITLLFTVGKAGQISHVGRLPLPLHQVS